MQSLGLHCEVCFLTTSRMCGAFGTMSLSLPCLFGRRRRRSLSTISLRVAKEKMQKSCLRLRHCHAGIFLAKLDHSKNGWLPMFIIRKIQRWHDNLGILPWFDSRCKYFRTTLPHQFSSAWTACSGRDRDLADLSDPLAPNAWDWMIDWW